MSASLVAAPVISIIVPVYNLQSIVFNALDSCIHQTFQHIEIVVVNDGSTDGSEEIIEQYKQKDKRIRHIKKQNEGLSFARKTGVEQALGEYIFHMDGDDTIALNAIEILYNQAMKHGADMVAGDINIIKAKTIYHEKPYSTFGVGTGTDFLEYILNNNLHYLWGKLIKRSLYDVQELVMVSDMKAVPAEDQLQMYQLCMFANTVATTSGIVYEYRIRENSITQRVQENKEFTMQQEYFANALYKLLNRFPYNYKIRQQINERILRALYLGMHRTGSFVVDKKKSGNLMRKTLLDSIFSNGSLLFTRYQLLARCAAVLVYPGMAYKVKAVIK